jgi:hypothetical protein
MPNGGKIMLHRGNKLFVILLLITTVVSCNRYKEYDAKEIKKIRDNATSMSKSILGEEEYNLIYSNMNDTINVWNKYHRYYGVSKTNMVDSILCVNKSGDKLITSILLKQVLKDGEQENIIYFYGVKIKGNWYFFYGATMVLLREAYQKDIHQPLSFEKLKQIATWNIYRGYLRKNRQGEWEVNERFFSGMSNKNMTVSGYGSCFDCKTEEEYYMYLVRRNWSQEE